MDVVRITELQPKTYVEQGDYIAIDNQSDGTKKVQFTNLLDDTLSQENKIAPANVVGDEIATIRAAVGSPLKASTVAQMTDTNKIYVYVGSESGYTNGNWYYWNGSAWVSGGVYNSVAVVTDPTLTLSGVPADAKATGDEVTNLKADLSDLADTQLITYFEENTISGTRSHSTQVNIPAGKYHLDIESIVSSDTQYATSRIIFYYSSGSKSIDVARNTAISQDIIFASDVNQISIYGAHSYSDSADVTFTVSNMHLYEYTQLYERLADLDKSASTIGNINFGTVSEFLFDGRGTLSSDNFEQGYMSNGTGWISTGSGDSLKYISFRNHAKLHKGTKVNIDCATLYCAIDLYADDNWSASSVRLDHVDYMQSTSYELPSDGYLCLTVSTSNKYASRVAITPSDFDEDIKIYPKTESGAEVNAVLYEGEKIDVARHYCQAESYMTMTHASTRSMQGGACYGDYFFQFMDKFSGCAIYDLSNKSLIQLISLTEVDTYHCNNANFGTEFYDADDAFPLLYVSMENTAEHKVNVYRVTNVNDAYGLTLVQTITWDAPSINSVYYPNAVIDTDNNRIIQIGYSTNSYQASNSNKIKVNIFDLPLLSAGDITLTDSDKIDSFILPSLQATQGAVCHNGKIIQAYGLTSDYQIRVIDLTKKQFVTKIDLTNATLSAVAGTEQEALFIYDGNIFCSNVDKKIWKLIV